MPNKKQSRAKAGQRVGRQPRRLTPAQRLNRQRLIYAALGIIAAGIVAGGLR